MSDYNELRRAVEQAHTDQQEAALRDINSELDSITAYTAKWQRVSDFGAGLDSVVRILSGALVGSFLGFSLPAVLSGKSAVETTGLYAPLFFALILTGVFFLRLGLLMATARSQRIARTRLAVLRLRVDSLRGDGESGES